MMIWENPNLSSNNLEIPLSADPSADSGVQQVTVHATFKYSTEVVKESFSFNIKVSGSTGQTGEGRLAVVGYSVNPAAVSAGSNCKLTLNIKNTGSSAVKDAAVTLGGLTTEGFTMNNSLDTQYISMKIKNTGKVAIENVKITVSSAADASTGGAFSPANSSNTFFVQSIPAGGVIEESIDLLPKADAPPKSYGLDIAFNYEAVVNKERIEMNPTETISIPLTQPDRFEVGELQMWGPVMVGETLGGYVSYVNKGKSTIFNLSVKVEGEGFTTAESETYVGNVESGSGDSYELALNTNQAGTLAGKLIFSYEDANGEVKEIVKSACLAASSMLMASSKCLSIKSRVCSIASR